MLRLAVYLVLLAAAVVTGAAVGGGPLAGVVAAIGVAVLIVVRALLPRLAHISFEAGRAAEARRRYQLVAAVSLSRRRRAAARVSMAGAELARGRHHEALSLLEAIDPEALDPPSRAGWLNNRAYARLRGGARGDAAAAALSDVRTALTLRPDVPALLHTEGLALLACGRAEEAVRVFEALWQAGDVSPRLEAERCHDLARAWTELGEADYAADYRRRAGITPDAPWASVEGPGPVAAPVPHLDDDPR